MAGAGVRVLRADQRYRSGDGSITSQHCFSAGAHYDPGNAAFGPLVACDEHAVAPGAGFARHRHVGVVIVSWPIRGRLVHEDALGRRTEVAAGSMQRLDASAGVEHGEFAGADEPARFVQMAVRADPAPASAAREPVHLVRAVGAGALVVVTTVHTPSGPATLAVARLGYGGAALSRARAIDLAPHAGRFLFVVSGAVEVLADPGAGSIDLRAGDSVRATAVGALTLRATPTGSDRPAPAEVLVWDLPG